MLTKDGGVDDDPYLVASASSDGFIRVWDARMVIKGKPNPLAEAKTKSRLTCLAGSSLKCEYSCLFLYTYWTSCLSGKLMAMMLSFFAINVTILIVSVCC